MTRGGFLRQAIDRIEEQLNQQQKLNAFYRTCPGSSDESADCVAARIVVTNLPAALKEARQDLALSYRDDVLQLLQRDVSGRIFRLNDTLSDLGTMKAVHWQKLTSDERAEAQRTLDQIVAGARAEAKRHYPQDPEKAESLARLLIHHERIARLQLYTTILSKLPIFNFIGQPVLTSIDLAHAMNQVQANITAEKAANQKRREILDRWMNGASQCAQDVELSLDPRIAALSEAGPPPCTNVPRRLFELLSYRSVVERLALQSSSLKSSLKTLREEQAIRNIQMFLIAVPVSIAMFAVAPPLVAVALGVGGTVLQIYQANMDVSLERQRQLIGVTDTGLIRDTGAVKDAVRNRTVSYLVAPLAFTGIAGWTVVKLSQPMRELLLSIQTLQKLT